MLPVLDIPVNRSCLAGRMKAAMKDGREMPEEVKALKKSVTGAAVSRMDDQALCAGSLTGSAG